MLVLQDWDTEPSAIQLDWAIAQGPGHNFEECQKCGSSVREYRRSVNHRISGEGDKKTKILRMFFVYDPLPL